MPSSPNYKRDYKQEYKTAKKRREVASGSGGQNAQRTKARRKMISAGKVKRNDGKDVAHKDNNTRNNSSSNLKVQSRSANRSFRRTKSGGRKK